MNKIKNGSIKDLIKFNDIIILKLLHEQLYEIYTTKQIF